MKIQAHNIQENLVMDLRKIRDQISNEIKDMTFEEERAYLDKLLNKKETFVTNAVVSNTIIGNNK